MTHRDDDFTVSDALLDEATVDALLSGADVDLPGRFLEVGRVLAPLRPNRVLELPAAELLDRMEAAAAGCRPATRRRPRALVAAVAAAASLLLGVGGLAEANALPAPIQRFVAHALDRVGIPAPAPADTGQRPPDTGGSSPSGAATVTPASTRPPTTVLRDAGPGRAGSGPDGPRTAGTVPTGPGAPLGGANPGNGNAGMGDGVHAGNPKPGNPNVGNENAGSAPTASGPSGGGAGAGKSSGGPPAGTPGATAPGRTTSAIAPDHLEQAAKPDPALGANIGQAKANGHSKS